MEGNKSYKVWRR